MSPNLQLWRKRNRLTQVDAATLLGVSQTYLSLLEKGLRPVTPELRSRLSASVVARDRGGVSEDRLRADLSALGYPGFTHIAATRGLVRPDVLMVSVLAMPDADARIVEALPWVVRECSDRMNFAWLVRQAKLRNLQNRVGFVLQLAEGTSVGVAKAVAELERARLLQEDTLCWDSMRPKTRSVLRERRSELAAHWNVVTMLRTEEMSRVQ